MEGLLRILMELLNFFQNVIRVAFDKHWAVGAVVVLLGISITVAAFQYIVAGLAIYLVVKAFASGNYVVGGTGLALLFLVALFGQWGIWRKSKRRTRMWPNA